MPVVVQLSDVHLRARPSADAPPDERDVALLATVAAIRSADIRPDLVVLTGDLADDGSVDACERIRRCLEPWGVPIVAVAGNHDRPDSVAEVFGPPVRHALGDWCVVPLDTYRPDAESGRIDVAATADELDAAPGKWLLAVLHHPPVSPSTHPFFGLDGADGLLDVCAARPRVRALASGHLHESFEVQERGVRVFGAPSTWFALEHDGPEYRVAPAGAVGARVFRLGADGELDQEIVRRD